MKRGLLGTVVCLGMASGLMCAQTVEDRLAEHISFYESFDDSIQPDQARGDHRLQVARYDETRVRYIQGVLGPAVLGAAENVQNLNFKIQDNVDFSRPGSLAFWFNPVDWVMQRPDTPPQGKTKWKQTMSSGFFATGYSRDGYVVFQRRTSHVPGELRSAIMLQFINFKDISHRLANKFIWNVELKPKTWHHLALTWDGLSYQAYLDGQELLKTAIPVKLTADRLHKQFCIYMAKGLAYDEFYIFDKQLAPEEITAMYKQFIKK